MAWCRRRGRRRRPGEPGHAAAQPQPAAARRPGRAPPPHHGLGQRPHLREHARPPVRPVVRGQGDRRRHPTAARGRERHDPTPAPGGRRVPRRHGRRRRDVQRLPARVRPGRPAGDRRHPPPSGPPLHRPQPRVPPALHVGPGHLTPDQRRRGHRRAARPRSAAAHHVDPDARSASASSSSCSIRCWRLRRLAVDARAVPDDPMVPAPQRAGLPGDARGHRPGHRPLRRVAGRHPGRPRLPPRAAEPGDLRGPRRPLPRRQHLVGSPRRRLRTGRAVRRSPHRGLGAAVRRLPGDRRAASASACSPRSCCTCAASSSPCRS